MGLWTWGGEPPHPPGGGEVVGVVSRVSMLPSGSLIAGVGLLAKTPVLGSRALSILTDLHLIPGTLESVCVLVSVHHSRRKKKSKKHKNRPIIGFGHFSGFSLSYLPLSHYFHKKIR